MTMQVNAPSREEPDLSGLSIKELRYIALLTQTLSFVRAADLAGISQSALSQSIAKTERTIGMQLFVRNRRSVNATPVALLIAEQAERVIRTMKELQVQVEDMRDAREGHLRFGVGIFAANHLLNPIMSKICQRFPEAQIRVVVAPPAELIDRLRAWEIDFFVAANDPQFHDKDTLHQHLYADELVVACRPDHPLARLSNVTHLDLIRYPTVTYDGQFFKRQIWPMLASAQEFELLDRNFPAIALQNPWVMSDLAMVSDYVICATRFSLHSALQSGALRTIVPEDLDTTVNMELVERSDAAQTPLAKGVIAAIREVMTEQGLG